MMKKYCFNMIEIILAISIIAIGTSSVMALFISGIKTGNDTVASNSVPDMSESILSFIRAKVDECRGAEGWKDTELAKVAPSSVSGTWDIDSYLGESTDGEVVKTDDNGRFLYRQLMVSEFNSSGMPTKYIPTFSALATVKRVAIDANRFNDIVLSNPDNVKGAESDKKASSKDAGGQSGADLMKKFRLAVQVTIQYPADAPKDSKVYIMEFFNDKYDRFAMEGENAAPTP